MTGRLKTTVAFDFRWHFKEITSRNDFQSWSLLACNEALKRKCIRIKEPPIVTNNSKHAQQIITESIQKLDDGLNFDLLSPRKQEKYGPPERLFSTLPLLQVSICIYWKHANVTANYGLIIANYLALFYKCTSPKDTADRCIISIRRITWWHLINCRKITITEGVVAHDTRFRRLPFTTAHGRRWLRMQMSVRMMSPHCRPQFANIQSAKLRTPPRLRPFVIDWNIAKCTPCIRDIQILDIYE